jgi:para-nitrobenzyl esterase
MRVFPLVTFLVVFYVQAFSQQELVVKTKAGLVSGSLNSKGDVRIFKGVPFAAPPVGEWRWKEPQPVQPWKGVLKCDQFPPSAIQPKPVPFLMWTEEFITPPEPLSEDCLYLNIWSPAKTTREKLPVLVWIHGGGFVSGSGACAIYDGEAMARENIIYISINYRLGVFGFLAHPGLTRESPHHASGNYGLLDQIAALKWIQNNIEAFGGDPARVTIAGQSAGSMSVHALAASPLAKGLFHGAIAQSGASFTRSAVSLNDAEKKGEILSQKLGKPGIAALRKLSADSVLLLGSTLPFGTFSPITDGYCIPEDMKTIFKNKKHNDVPLLAGWVTGDANLFNREILSAGKFRSFVAETYGIRKDEFLEVFPAPDDEAAKQSQQKLGMLQFAGYPDHLWAHFNSRPGFLYYFSYVPADKPNFPDYGAFHTSEVPFALRTLSRWDRPWRAVDYEVERTMSAYWINFIKTGNPNGHGLPEWKLYDRQQGHIMEFSEKPELKEGLFRKELQFLESLDN